MRQQQKATIRFTFDCPIELHTIAKMKAAALKQSIKDYLVNLMVKDAVNNPLKVMSEKAFKKELKKIIEQDEELMKKLANR